MSRLRTFLAVPLSDEIRDRLAALRDRAAPILGKAKWVEEENLHVTLLFLGDVNAEEIPAVCRAAREGVAAFRPFVLGVQGLGCFPNARRPRILWAGITPGADALQAVYEAIALRLEPLGFRREDRPYTPHVTLGRARSEHLGPNLPALLETPFAAGEMTVDEVHVLSSELTRRGPHYQILGRARLGE